MVKHIKINSFLFPVFLSVVALPHASFARTIVAGPATPGGSLGAAYLTDRDSFGPSNCLVLPAPTPAGQATASNDFSSSMSEQQASSELGFQVGTHAEYGMYSGSGAATFLKNSISNAMSVSAVWESTYTFPDQILNFKQASLTAIGNASINGNWNESCGQEFVGVVQTGAKLFFSIRVDFASEQEKEDFQAKFSISGPMFGVDGSMSQASAKFSRSTRVTVSAYQLGGDPTKLGQIFNTTDTGPMQFTQCTLGDLESCSVVINNAIKYASSTFPNQLNSSPANGNSNAPRAAGPADLAYITYPYSELAINTGEYPGLDEAVTLARQNLQDDFEKQFADEVLAERLLRLTTLGTRGAAIQAEQDKLLSNIKDTLLPASDVCYSTPKDCPAAQVAARKKLLPIDETVFQPESFQKLCLESLPLSSDASLRITMDALSKAIGSKPLSSHDQASDVAACNALESKIRSMTVLNLNPYKDKDGNPVAIAGCSPQNSSTCKPAVIAAPPTQSSISDLRPLATFYQLRELSIPYAEIEDISPLAGLHNLTMLNLSTNRITDLTPLSDLQDMEYLYLERNRIQKVDTIANFRRIQSLMMEANPISDLSQLQFFPSAQFMGFQGTQVSSDSFGKFCKAVMPDGNCDTKNLILTPPFNPWNGGK